MNYTELLAAVEGYSENNNLTSIIDTIIDIAEARLYREIDFAHARKVVTSALNSGDPFVQTPTDMLFPRYFQILSGTTRSFLLPKDISFINEFWPDRTSTGTPQFYAIMKQDPIAGTLNHFLVAPTPSAGSSVEIHYNFRPAKISSGNATTWLGTRAPDLLLAAVMLEVQIFQKGELASIGNSLENPGWWQTHYRNAVQRLIKEQEATLMTDKNRNG